MELGTLSRQIGVRFDSLSMMVPKVFLVSVYQSCLKIFGAIFCSRHSLNKRGFSRGSQRDVRIPNQPTLYSFITPEMNMKSTAIIAALIGSASAFAPASMTGRSVTSLNAEMSKSLPFLPRPEKLDGTMAGDKGFDPMGLSEIQQDLTYARWGELKNGRVAMLAVLGMIVQGRVHLPGEAYQNPDPFGAISTVGQGVNAQIFLFIGAIELANFNRHYDGSEPGEIPGFDGGFLKNKTPEQIMDLKEKEITHCRLAMIAFVGATVQTLLFHQPLL